MKTALVYDRINKMGGAERVLLALHALFPDAPLYTSVYDKRKAEWASVFDVKTSFLQNYPHIISNHEYYPFLMPIAFEQFNFDEYDLVISVTSESAKGIITKASTKHICYCLTPTRYLWSGYEEYFKNKFLKFFSYPIVGYLRNWDKIAGRRPDITVAISEEVKKRIKKYYDLDAQVVYPAFYMGGKKINSSVKKENFFLVVSRLVNYKRIDLAIEACNFLQIPLKIIGTGREEGKLKKIAGKTIEFLGNVDDDSLVKYYLRAKALIHPGIEDFGLTVIEAQKFNTPVIAFRGGGALETIKEGKTGVFFDEQNKESLIKVMEKFDGRKFKEPDFERQVDLFSFSSFKSNFLPLVSKSI